MIEERLCHSSVDTSNKLHVIENINTAKNKTCGVFDSACNKFVALKHIPKKLTDELFRVETESFSIGKKPLITRNDLSFAFICDVEKDEWSKEIFKDKNLFLFNYTVVPQIQL